MTYRKAVAVALLAASLVGCQPAPTPTTSGPSVVATGPDIEPTYECTPEFAAPSPSPSVHPTTCSRAVYDQMKARDAQYAEAERIYRELNDLDVRAQRGEKIPDRDLDALVSKGLASRVRSDYRKAAGEQRFLRGGDVRIVWLRRLDDRAPDSALALSACIDGSSATLMQKGRAVGKGGVIIRDLSFGQEAGTLKAVDARFETVQAC